MNSFSTLMARAHLTRRHRRVDLKLFSHTAIFPALLLCACTHAPPLSSPAPVVDAAFVSPERATGRSEKSGWIAKKTMVAAANPLAVEAGDRMLKRGGSAIDAAIATQMVLTLVEPQS